ncbi:unnamed protein product [Spirodela intermedia]|uniref:Uncharacterized protein n=1 Tax=Spirodela intermedia TaxID=51605 RepID=A0A7I8JSC5_SPIIN|nr:unnamed protein product [Spirodela intermedia]CAA6672665.1 unnamed protein product [Spirodela intermedia]
MGEARMEIHLDKLPLKRVESTDEAGVERFPRKDFLSSRAESRSLEIGTDEKRLDLIRRIDFSWYGSGPPWPWQGLVENLHLASQELSVIIDLINTVEANDAVAVAGMTRPKQLPNELLSDLSVSAATKLQRLRHLGKYFKQSSQALEKQVVREARFYGSLIRLQQNWKVKRQRQSAPGNEGFTIDLHDSSLSDPTVFSRPSLLSTVRIDHDPTGMLALQLPPKSCRSLHFGFSFQDDKIDPLTEAAVDESVQGTHSVLREIHQAIFEEQVFDLVNRETVDSPFGVNVTGMREDYLQLGIGQEASVYLCLRSSGKEGSNQTASSDGTCNRESGVSHSDSSELMMINEKQDSFGKEMMKLPNPICFEIYLRCILHENVFLRAKEGHSPAIKNRASAQSLGEGIGLLGYFCATIAHRVFSKKVFSVLENLVERVPYLHLLTHPTWHSRTSSWSINMKVPLSIVYSAKRAKHLGTQESKSEAGLQFHTKVAVNDESISISGEGIPNTIGSFKRDSMDMSLLNCYSCDIVDLPVILLQQVAVQVISWLHDEALVVGMKSSTDFLSLCLELGQSEKLRLVAHLDPEDVLGCISWWLVADNGRAIVKDKAHSDTLSGYPERRRFLGHVSLESLFLILMDLVRLSSSSVGGI